MSVHFFVTFIALMKTASIECISKKKVLRKYADLIIKVFEENRETSFKGRGLIPIKDIQVGD